MTDERREKLTVRVANLDCENEAAAIRRAMSSADGVREIEVKPTASTVTLWFDPAQVTPERLKERLEGAGFPPVERDATPVSPWRSPKVLASIASGVLLALGWILGRLGAPELVSVIAYATGMLIGGYFFAREAIEDLIFEREIGIELLMTAAAIAAAAMGEVFEGATLVFLYSMSEAAEGYTAEKTRSAIRALMKLAPATATVVRDGKEIEIAAEELVPGDVFLVRPGGSVPTDGTILTGRSAIDESPVTGESVPVEKEPGDTVVAGTINRSGALEVRATKAFAENTLSRIILLVEEAQERKGASQRFIERFGRWYSPLVLLGSTLAAIAPPLVAGVAWASSMRLGTILLVAAAPCALVISIPITLVAALGTGARRGILIKGGIHVEELARIRVVALDKTGTLTKGEPEVTDVVAVPGSPTPTNHDVLAVGAAIDRWSEHPLARAIVAAAESRGLEVPSSSDFQALVGAGATARVRDQLVHIGSRAYFAEVLGVDIAAARGELDALEQEGKSLVFIGTPEGLWGAIALRDNLRPEARDAIRALKALGIAKVVMLTGDNEGTARAIAREVGIDDVHAKLKPEDKVRHVRELAQRHGHLLMVGDGVNDAPALAEATVGVAMGAAGTDVALETADVALMADDLRKLVEALALGRSAQRLVRQNLILSTIVIAGMVTGTIAGVFTLPLVVLVHELSEFVVIGNGLRILRFPS
ncbi:MAG: cation-translocating P-type ATPase [Myxococcales bacterium]|nr:cation-translocating P-type ATPase [Myxococcales bacterium]MBK7194498.1 cation-translocating P-type ATPase [Myxococcales bacterium]